MSTLHELLNKYYYKSNSGSGIKTHTKIKDDLNSKPGGCYSIPLDKIDQFRELYFDHVFVKKAKTHLTEAQTETGVLAVDLDFRYPLDITCRQHTEEMVVDFIDLYLRELTDIGQCTSTDPFPIFVMEKPHVNIVEEKGVTKDGIHIIFGIQMHHALQLLLRERVIGKLDEVMGELPLSCNWDAVVDEGISRGTTNWQMYGSCKPGYDTYRVTKSYNVNRIFEDFGDDDYDQGDEEALLAKGRNDDNNNNNNDDNNDEPKAFVPFAWDVEECAEEFVCKSAADLAKVSVQNTSWKTWEVRREAQSEYNAIMQRLFRKSAGVSQSAYNTVTALPGGSYNYEAVALNIRDPISLKKAIDEFLEMLEVTESNVKDAHQYTDILPEKYYISGSHDLNTKVAFALHKTDLRLFLSWIMLRSKATDFNFSDIPALLQRWKSFVDMPTGVTSRTIRYFASQDAPEAFRKLSDISIDHLIDASVGYDIGDYGYGLILKQMFGDKYICTNVQSRTWWTFKHHRWHEDQGMSLRRRISEGVHDLYAKKRDISKTKLLTMDPEGENYKSTSKRCQVLSEICLKLRKTNDKNNIMREAAEIFFDGNFEDSRDENPYLLCTPSGVVDFKSKELRPGQPQDYITKCTTAPYIPSVGWTSEQHEFSREVDEFMHQLYPQTGLCEYVWNYDASTLIGIKKENIFAIHCGSGCNGKSKKMELMGCMGDYKTTIKVTVLTEKQGGVGGTSSEIAKLKGCRFVFMKEPNKGAVINEGIMKELTGGEEIECRALYKNSGVFFPQFSLSVCLNEMFEVNSNDDGTWRRMKVIDYLSKFKAPDEDTGPIKPMYIFPKNKGLSERFVDWGAIYLSMLIERAFITEGEVIDCKEVHEASTRYRHSQDAITQFLLDHVIQDPNGSIGKVHLGAAFKEWYGMENGGKKQPKLSEIEAMLNAMFIIDKPDVGNGKKTRWHGVRLIQTDDNGESEGEADQGADNMEF